MLLKEIKAVFWQELQDSYPKEEVNSFFFMLIEHHLGLQRFVLVLHPQYALSKKEEEPLFNALSRLKKEEPIQYILGIAQFMDLEFKVAPGVLIPRPETAELVDWVVDTVKDTASPLKILDIGTGSGCIAISLAKRLPQASITAIDISEKALQIAQENARTNQVNIQLVKANILDNIKKIETGDDFDIIVSNPPYVRELEKGAMHNNVLEHEPHLALFVPDEDPLKFYRAIAAFAQDRLREGGRLFFEINQYLGKETQQLLVDRPFKDIELKQDIFGNFRFLGGTKHV